jgi:hypothetical protein
MQQIIETIPPNELEYEASPSIYNLVSYLPKDTPLRNFLTDVRHLLELVYKTTFFSSSSSDKGA